MKTTTVNFGLDRYREEYLLRGSISWIWINIPRDIRAYNVLHPQCTLKFFSDNDLKMNPLPNRDRALLAPSLAGHESWQLAYTLGWLLLSPVNLMCRLVGMSNQRWRKPVPSLYFLLWRIQFLFYFCSNLCYYSSNIWPMTWALRK